MAMLKNYFKELEKENLVQYLVIGLLLIVYAGSLFFPLIDKDAAHHANIALYMYEHDNPFILMDRGKDYLDKPHFLFWSSLLFYEIFGVNTFSHRFPALLFALIAVYSIYKLTRHLSDKTTAKLAALLFATAQGVILSVNDARMETPLTAAIAFGLWQFIIYVDRRNFMPLVLATLGTAVAFATKGWLGPVIIFFTVFCYILLNRKWSVLGTAKTYLFIPLFFLFISPVLYGYYLQFDLHPEKIIRGKSGRSGIKFILWEQLFERAQGFDDKGRNSEYIFLFHTFLWAFFPWSILAYTAIVFWLRRMFVQKKWRSAFGFATLSFAAVLFLISFSKFKMPHYMIMLLPLAAMATAPFLRMLFMQPRVKKIFVPMQVILIILVILLILVLNYYFFPPANIAVWIAGTGGLLFLVYLLRRKYRHAGWKFVTISTALCLVFNFFVNYNFFPQLMTYQAGNEMVKHMKEKNVNIRDEDIVSLEQHAHTFDFYKQYNHYILEFRDLDSVYPSVKDKYFLFTMPICRHIFDSMGYDIKPVLSVRDANIARMNLRFLNPKTRGSRMDSLMLAKLIKR
jgi:4-amino-4-deoxy-L-arabinose transferase-like glycosyltransferase